MDFKNDFSTCLFLEVNFGVQADTPITALVYSCAYINRNSLTVILRFDSAENKLTIY